MLPDEIAPPVRVDGYGDGGFTVSGTRHKGPLILLPTHTLPWKGASIPLDATAASSLLAAAEGCAILLLGLGDISSRPGKEFLEICRRTGIEPDAMTTGAACRTWNVLVAEGRIVAAGLLPDGRSKET